MDISVLNTNFEVISVIDSFDSLIWTDRYNRYGDFELHTVFRPELLDVIKEDYYFRIKESEHIMIVEDIRISSDVENGDKLTVSGKSLESILTRRIVWSQTQIKDRLQNAVEKLLFDNFIRPSDPKRKIPNFVFRKNQHPILNFLQLDTQYTGDNVYDVITNLCDIFSMGFRITLNDANQFVFELYYGENRSYSQEENPYVIFSPKFENILNSNYYSSNGEYKNVVLIAGEGEGSARKTSNIGDSEGLTRRELFVDARDISSDIDGERTLSDSEYDSKLKNRGREKLKECSRNTAFEGEVDYFGMFRYGRDYFIGDIVQISNEYGHEGKVFISEVVTSQDNSGYSIYPTFKKID